RPRPLPAEGRKILLVRIDRIGDLVLSTPFLRNMRELFPSAEIVFLGRSFARELLAPGRLVDRILAMDDPQEVRSMSVLAQEGFDLAIDLHCDYILQPAFLARRARAACTVGFDVGGRGALFDIPVPVRGRKHFVEELLDILRTLAYQPRPYPPEVQLNPQSCVTAGNLLTQENVGERYAVFHPGGFYATQRWSAVKFAELADSIAQLGLRPVFIGGKKDRATLEEIRSKMSTQAVLLWGQTIGVAAAVIGQSTVFVGNNSGPLHIACALNIPSVSTMGPTDPVRFWPVSQLARVVHTESLERISVEEMFVAVRAALGPIETTSQAARTQSGAGQEPPLAVPGPRRSDKADRRGGVS
ncbi:MAG TPA: glycosyltransferase family 9 protein, partial [Candidatus Acidoferrum sp.]|nr:glycosyltransferase family 9 protein [Candidatus Acidoferrum sp.]